ncbi:MAG: hypothetical protein U0670_21530 [Anaerolineae bacterium]
MNRTKLISFFLFILFTLTLVGGTFAQPSALHHPIDAQRQQCPDGSAPNPLTGLCPPTATPVVRTCPDGSQVDPQTGGCPPPTATPPPSTTGGDNPQPPQSTCPGGLPYNPDGTCPTPAAETPARIPPHWWTFNACLVENPGPEADNVRSFVPDPASPQQPVILGTLPAGGMFAPLYVEYDSSNTPWYGALDIVPNLPPGTMGWVSGAVLMTNHVCDHLGPPPSVAPLADRPVCLLIVPEGEGADVFTDHDRNTPVLMTIAGNTLFAGHNSFTDAAGMVWYQGEIGSDGWIPGNLLLTEGNCDFEHVVVTRSYHGPIIANGGGGSCVLTVPDGPGAKLYYGPFHDEALVVTIMPPGHIALASGSDYDVYGHLWYGEGSGWVDSSDVIATGPCAGLPLPDETGAVCKVFAPSTIEGAEVFDNPALNANVIAHLTPGTQTEVNARLDDVGTGITWFHTVFPAGWINGTGMPMFHSAHCLALPQAAPAPQTSTCQVYFVDGPTGIYTAPSHDGSGLVGSSSSGGPYPVTGMYVDENGTLWYNIGGPWVDSHEVTTTGDCTNLPPYQPAGAMCILRAPLENGAVPEVYFYTDYQNPVNVVTHTHAPAIFIATHAANYQGMRWYYAQYNGEQGWVRSTDVIEDIPAVCDALSPMYILNLSSIGLDALQVWPISPIPDTGPQHTVGIGG